MASANAPCLHARQEPTVTYDDLGSSVFVGCLPQELAADLASLYSSCCSAVEYFQIMDDAEIMHTCLLDDPRHVLVFTVSGRTAEVLNKVIEIDPDSTARMCRSIFRCFPRVRRIHCEVKFAPQALALSNLQLYSADDMVINLPATEQEYRSGLRKPTRRHIPQYMNGLRRRYPEFSFDTVERDAIDADLVTTLTSWNIERMSARGTPSVFQAQPDMIEKLTRLARASGVAHRYYIGGELAAAYLVLPTGTDAWVWAGAFDTKYEHVHLGFLSLYLTIVAWIEKGAPRIHLTWNSPGYKERLGAHPVTAWRLSVFRSPLDRLLYLRELAWVLRLRISRRSPVWAFRHAVKRLLLRAGDVFHLRGRAQAEAEAQPQARHGERD